MSGYDSSYKGWKTEYDAYIAYQECLLRGEVQRINLPGDDDEPEGDEEKTRDEGKKGGKGNKRDEGRKGDDGNGDASDEYFADDSWPI